MLVVSVIASASLSAIASASVGVIASASIPIAMTGTRTGTRT